MVKGISAISAIRTMVDNLDASMSPKEASECMRGLALGTMVGIGLYCDHQAAKAADELKNTTSPYLLDKNGEPIYSGTDFMPATYNNPLYDPNAVSEAASAVTDASPSLLELGATTGAENLPIEALASSQTAEVFRTFLEKAADVVGDVLDTVG